MQIYAYLRIVSDETKIRLIHQETNLTEAAVRRLKAPRGTIENEYWWHWETKRTPVDADDVDGSLNRLLLRYRPIFPFIRKYPEGVADIYLQIVTVYEKGEEPQGMSLSRETISLLSEMGAALDDDTYVRG